MCEFNFVEIVRSPPPTGVIAIAFTVGKPLVPLVGTIYVVVVVVNRKKLQCLPLPAIFKAAAC